MISRGEFSTPEWNTIQTAVIGTIKYVSMSTTNYFGDKKEYFFAKREIKRFADEFDSVFINDLSDFSSYKSPLPAHADNDFKSIEVPVRQSIALAIEAISKRSPETAETFKQLLIHLAENVSTTYKTASPPEIAAIETIKQAILTPPVTEKRWDPSNPLA